MKKLLMLLTLMAFVVAAPLGLAAAEKEINCCSKAGCAQMTKAECKKEKGKVVKDCSRCGGLPRGSGSFESSGQERGRTR